MALPPKKPAPAKGSTVLDGLTTVIMCVRAIVAHNVKVCLKFAEDPTLFGQHTEKQRAAIRKSAATLLGVPLDATPAVFLAALKAAEASGKNLPRYSWVHQRFAPYRMPGESNRLALQALYEARLAAGLVSDGLSYVDAVTQNVWDDESEEGVLYQRPTKGGFLVAVKEDADANKAARPAKSAKRNLDATELDRQMSA